MKCWVWIAIALCSLSPAISDNESEEDFSPQPIPLQISLYGNNDTGQATNLTDLIDESSEGQASITNGYNAKHGQYPYVVVILLYYYYYHYHVCSGVIINQHSVLTSAYCVRYLKYNYYYYSYYVAVGILNLRKGSYNPGAQVLKVASYTIHPGYNPYAPGHPDDLAILHLKCRIKYNAYVKPAPLATKYDGRFYNKYCFIIGWGYTEWRYPTILQTAGIYSISNYQCRLFWAVSPKARILDSHICMYRYPVSACYGDAGGPLICHGKVAGVISWGSRSCNGCFPGVSTRVSSYTRWIRTVSTLS